MKLKDLLDTNFNVEPIDPNGCYNNDKPGGCTRAGGENCPHAKVDPSIQRQILHGPFFICDLTGERLRLSQFSNPKRIPRKVGSRNR